MNDFKRINVVRRDMSIKPWTPDYWEGFHYTCVKAIVDTLKENHSKNKLPSVVITHHGGHPYANGDAPYKQNNMAGYVSDIRYLTHEDYAPDWWICGHVHEQLEFKEGNTQFGVNCYGYEDYEHKMCNDFTWKWFRIEGNPVDKV